MVTVSIKIIVALHLKTNNDFDYQQMQQQGLIIGFANQQRKRVLQGYQNQRTVFENQYIIQKAQGFIGDRKEEIQQEIIQMISEHPIVNTVYIVLKYQRIDIMRKQLSLIMQHFKNYINNIYLIVANFQLSKDKQKEQESIRSKLVQQYNLKNYFQYQFGQTFDQDSIYFDSQEIMGEDIIHYFHKTICQGITFDGNLMNLYPKINYQLLQQIEQYMNSGQNAIINQFPPKQIEDGLLLSDEGLNEKQQQLGQDIIEQETNFDQQNNNSLTLYENIKNKDKQNKKEHIIYQQSYNNRNIRQFNRNNQQDQQNFQHFINCYFIELPQSPDIHSERKLIIPNQFFQYITIKKITHQSYTFQIHYNAPIIITSDLRKIKEKLKKNNPRIRFFRKIQQISRTQKLESN
ncbi:hypothetical protein pb186bvf_016447 [Paramecium bursaria]